MKGSVNYNISCYPELLPNTFPEKLFENFPDKIQLGDKVILTKKSFYGI